MSQMYTIVTTDDKINIPDLRLHPAPWVRLTRGNNGVEVTANTNKGMVTALKKLRDSLDMAIEFYQEK